MKELIKLQSLCNTTNRRFQAGQNDDDQVKALFNYAKKNSSVCVVIGYDSYNAIKSEEVIQFYKGNPDAEVKIENSFSYVKMQNGNVQILTSLLN